MQSVVNWAIQDSFDIASSELQLRYGMPRQSSTTFMFCVLRDTGRIKVEIGLEVAALTLLTFWNIP